MSVPGVRLTAKDAFRLSTETAQSDRTAFFKIRDAIYAQIRMLATHRPPCYKTSYDVPPTFPSIPEYNVKNVFVLLYTRLYEDGYKMTWNSKDPLTLHIDWSDNGNVPRTPSNSELQAIKRHSYSSYSELRNPRR